LLLLQDASTIDIAAIRILSRDDFSVQDSVTIGNYGDTLVDVEAACNASLIVDLCVGLACAPLQNDSFLLQVDLYLPLQTGVCLGLNAQRYWAA
jgi:hypothetical protein